MTVPASTYQRFKNNIRRRILVLSGKQQSIRKKLKCNSNWIGSTYGGFYIYPDILGNKSTLYSFGIGEDISFDLEMIEKFGCIVYAFDPTPKSVNWLKSQHLPENFNVRSYGISKETGSMDFYLPKNENHVSGSTLEHANVSENKIQVDMKSFSDIILELGHDSVDVIKMDIEGAEYDVISGILNSQIHIGQILIEFHDRFFVDGKKRTKQALDMLNDFGFEVFAMSDSFEEVSFLNTKLDK